MLIQRIGLYYAGTEVSQETVSSLPTYLEKRLAFNLIDLARARNFEEMLKVLARKLVLDILRGILPEALHPQNGCHVQQFQLGGEDGVKVPH